MNQMYYNIKNYIHRNEEGKYNKWDCLVWGIIGAFVFITIYGLLPLDVTYDYWLINGYVEKDVTQHYAGWLAYRQSEWSIPLGKIDGLGGTMVTFTDSIPLVAMFFKCFSALLPETFQYFGLYIFLCFILQGVSSGLLISLFSKDKILTNLGVVLFCYSPIMIERAFRHTALASHWLILFMLYFYFKSRKEKKMDVRCCILPILSIAIHPYFLPVLFGLMFACLVELLVINKRTIFKSGLCLLGTLCTTVAVGFLIGALGSSSSLGGTHYGYFSMNLNAIINPISCSGIVWSRFLKVLPQTLGNYDGFNYLGLGVLLMMVILVISLILNRHKLKQIMAENIILIVLCIGFSIFAITNIVTLNGDIWFSVPLPAKLISYAAIFRASSRIFYPVFYLIILAGINGLLMLSNFKWKKVALMLVVIIQLWDLSPALITKFESFDKDAIDSVYSSSNYTGSELWNDIARNCKKIKMLNNSFDYKLAAFGGKAKLNPDISISSSQYKGGTNLNSIYQSNIQEILEGRLENNVVYVTSDENLLTLLLMENKEVNLYYSDGYYILADKDMLLKGEKLDASNYRLSVIDITDKNWTNGISNFNNQKVLLFKYSDVLMNKIKNNEYLSVNGQTFLIEKVEEDGKWIHVTVDRNAEECKYPNEITFSNNTERKVANLTDKNWTNGISNFKERRIILFEYSVFLENLLRGSSIISCKGREFIIKSIECDEKWIHVEVDSDATQCGYPNIISIK